MRPALPAEVVALGNGASVSGTNSMALGNGASVTAANEIFLGNSAIVSIGGIVNWTATSDGRFKSHVREDVPGLAFIDQLRPVTYNFDPEAHAKFSGKSISEQLKKAYEAKRSIRYSGFIAQEVAETAQSLGYDFSGIDAPEDDTKDIYGLRYAEFVVPLVKSTHELHQKVKELEAVIELQNTQLSAYQKVISNMEKRLVAVEEFVNVKSSSTKILASRD